MFINSNLRSQRNKKSHLSVLFSSLICYFHVRAYQADLSVSSFNCTWEKNWLFKTYAVVFEYFMDYSKASGMSNAIHQAVRKNRSWFNDKNF